MMREAAYRAQHLHLLPTELVAALKPGWQAVSQRTATDCSKIEGASILTNAIRPIKA